MTTERSSVRSGRTLAQRFSRGLLPALAMLAANFPLPASAHPHVFPLARVNAIFDDQGRFVAVHEKWSFDYDFSAIFKEEADLDKSGYVDEDETAKAQAEFLAWIPSNDFYTRLTVAAHQVAHKEPADYKATFFAGKLYVEFTLPLAEPADPNLGVGVDVFDGEFYYDFEFDYPDVEATNPPSSCIVDRREQPNLDPVAVMLIKRLGLSADPSVIDDPAAGYAVRVAVTCGAAAAALSGPSAPAPTKRQNTDFTDN